MTAFLAGIVSCLTPEALLLLPLLPAAVGAGYRRDVMAIAFGLGLSLVVTGIIAVWTSEAFGFDATWLRRFVCVLLLLQGIILTNRTLVERYPSITGGHARVFADPSAFPLGGPIRLTLLALLVGANWAPPIGPTLGKASLMAADARNSDLAFAMLFVFGMGAASPWILLGRGIRRLWRPKAGRMGGVPAGGVPFAGVAGKRILGVTLVAVAILGMTGLDAGMVHALDSIAPAWTRSLAVRF